MRLSISHATSYAFSREIAHGLQRLRLTPKDTHGQEVLDWHMAYEGARPEVEYDDQHHNRTTLISVEPGARMVKVTCHGTVRTADHSGVVGQHTGHMPIWCFLRSTPLTTAGPKVRALLAGVDADRANRLDFLHALSQAIRDAVAYQPGMTDSETTAEQSLAAGHGVCQDHAHIFIAAGRLLDIPMRYVGGYLQMDGQVEQAAGHGWAEAHVEGIGWVGFDVSNAISPDERYVRVASGCDYGEAAPITGFALGAGEMELHVRLTVAQDPVGQGQQQQQS